MTIKHLIKHIKDQGVEISLVGNDLEISYDTDELDEDLVKLIRENKSEIISFFRKNSAELEFTIPNVPAQESYPLSSSQRRLWILSQFEEGNVAYNVPGVHVFEGTLDRDALENSFKQLISRHESLRTVFREVSTGDIRQCILPESAHDFKLGYYDLRGQLSEALLQDLIGKEFSFVFDLQEGPLLRAQVYQMSDSRYVFNYVMHHIISDGWTMQILMKELMVLYNSILSGDSNPLPPLRIQYKDYAQWQQEQLGGDLLLAHRSYWLSQFSGDLPVLELPADRARPSIKSYRGAVVQLRLSQSVTGQLKQFVHSEGSTLFMGLLAGINSLFYRYTGQEDIIIGSPIAGREHADLHDQIGFYVNTLALRSRFSGSYSYRRLLSEVRGLTLDAYEHQSYPFDELVEALDLKRDMSRNALFDVLLVLQNTELHDSSGDQSLKDLRISGYDGSGSPTSKFDLTFNVVDQGSELELGLEYNTDIYDRSTIERLGTHLEGILSSALSAPDVSIDSLDYISKKEQNKLVREFNDTFQDHGGERTVIDLMEEQVEKSPDEIALVFEEVRLSYRALNARVNQLSRYLQNHGGLMNGHSVGVYLDRSEWSVISMLSIMKLGCIYVPIDKGLPDSRVSHILKESEVHVLLVDAEPIDRGCLQLDIHKIFLEDESEANLGLSIKEESSCFTIYTSGSTGVPKGVEQVHKMLYNLIMWDIKGAKMNVKSKHLQFSSYSFDSSIHDVYYSLSTGGELHVLNDNLRKDLWSLKDYLLKNSISTLSMPYAALKSMFAEIPVESFKGHKIKEILSTGEQLYIDGGLRKFLRINPEVVIYNLYGPSETHVVTGISYSYGAGDIPEKASIGYPIDNSSIYILDKNRRLVPEGVIGELYIGGYNLAKGYQNRSSLTEEKFVENVFVSGERMYRSGDLGRWLSDGTIDYLGRIDHQVKVRGYRVELGEIELTLKGYECISDAVVITRRDEHGNHDLVAYLLTDAPITSGDIRLYLSKALPDYMIPSHYVLMDKFPLTSNGKIDKRALPEPSGMALSTGVSYVPAGNQTETKLIKIWEEILGKEPIGVKDNFFDLGGHSLKLTRLVSRIHKEFEVKLPLRELFNHATLQEQAVLLSQSESSTYMRIPVVAEAESYVLSSSQRRLWVLSQFEEGNVAYNIPGVYAFEGSLNIENLEWCFLTLIKRHEILRTVFREEPSGDVRQFVLDGDSLAFRLAYEDLRGESNQDLRLNELVRSDFDFVFDLASGPLLRASVYQLAEDRYVFAHVLHHIISDGWSMEILVKELLSLYNSIQTGLSNPFTPHRIQYKDYAVWQQSQLKEPSLNVHRSYWLNQFSGELPVLELPTDRVRPLVNSYRGRIVCHKISGQITQKLKAFVYQENGTLFMGLLAMLNSLLYRYTGQEDIVIGSPIASREHTDLHDQIGCYINTLALRTQFQGQDSFRQLLQKTRQLTLDAYEHQSYPFDELVDDLELKKDLNRNALFDVMLVLQNTELHHDSLSDRFDHISVRGYQGIEENTSKFDLAFNAVEVNGELHVDIQYYSDIFDQSTIKRLGKHMEQLLESMLTYPDSCIASLEYLKEGELALIRDVFNATHRSYPEDKTIIELFEAQVLKTPDALAVVFENNRLTYKELNTKANQLGNYLKGKSSLKPNETIGVLLERSEWLVVAVLGILKTGAAYVPIDPALPVERIQFIIKDSSCVSVFDEEERNRFFSSIADCSTDNPEVYPSVKDLAYIIYTSGTTGTPKGVMIEHKSVSNMTFAWQEAYGLVDKKVNLLQLANVYFDVFMGDVCRSILIGGTAYICPVEVKVDPVRLYDFILSNQITILEGTPGILIPLMEYMAEGNRGIGFLETVILGSEVLHFYLFNKFNQFFGDRLQVVNSYGVTETTIDSTWFTADFREDSSKPFAYTPIGRPFANNQVYILNAYGAIQPVGIPGEICIAGMGLARGYVNLEDLTKEKFVSHPFKPEQKIYRTGDLGQWLPDGNIGYFGRMDNQVKVRGYRIELGEIETHLRNYEYLIDAVVLAKVNSSGDNELIAYLLASSEISLVVLRAYLGGVLPSYMIPSHYVFLDKLPLTPNGKVDKKALLASPLEMVSHETEYIGARNETEGKLIDIWEQLLSKKGISVKDDFFELGGHSLKLIRLINCIHRDFGVKLPLRDLYAASLVESQSLLILNAKHTEEHASIPICSPSINGYVLSSSQRRLWILNQFKDSALAYNIPSASIFEGQLSIQALTQGLTTLIGRHEILRTVFRQDENGNVKQFVKEASDAFCTVEYQDLRNEADEQLVNSLVLKDGNWVFDLETGPLLRIGLYQLQDEQYVFTYVMHHIISDGWSAEILMKELIQLYNAYTVGTEISLLPLRIQYKEYAHWQQKQLEGHELRKHRGYWLSRLSGELPVLDLPMQKTRPSLKTYNGNEFCKPLKKELTKDFKELVLQEGGTLFMGLLAVFNSLLYRYTGQEDIIIGSPVAGREHTDLHDQIGFYVNTLALRTQFTGADSFRQMLNRVKSMTLEAYENQAYPFDQLVEELNLVRDLSRSALFDMMLVLDNNEGKESIDKRFNGISVKNYPGTDIRSSKFDLTLSVFDAGDELKIYYRYNTDVYRHSTIEQLSIHFESLMASVVLHPDQSIGALDYLQPEEKHRLLNVFNTFSESNFSRKTIVEWFEEQATKTPENSALLFEGRQYTYKQLNEISNQFANHLIQDCKIVSNDRVAINIERSEWTIIAMIGILKAGAAYVPIDFEYPSERIEYMLSDSQSHCVVDQQRIFLFEGKKDSYSKSDVKKDINASDLAYVIYTSGSTGNPKGVMITHQALSDYIEGILEHTNIRACKKFGLLSTAGADLGNTVIFPSLVVGGRLQVFSKEDVMNTDVLAASDLDCVKITPSHWKALQYNDQIFAPNTSLIFGGEQLTHGIIASLRENQVTCQVYNHYGPTETTIGKLLNRIDLDHIEGNVPLGSPFCNSKIYILSESLSLQPIGVVGEICIGGDGLSPGYLNRPELTKEKFVTDPFDEGNKMYKTGDLGRWLENGQIEYLGRADDQIKIRGFRIELGEIENQLRQLDGVQDAVVLAIDNEAKEKDLVAYLVTKEKSNLSELRVYLSKILPDYMIPSYFLALDELPLTSNGKVNRRALPELNAAEINTGITFIGPRNEVEVSLIQLWKQVLGDRVIGVKNNFFELGGHSLKATKLMSLVHKKFAVKILLKDFFSHPVLEDQALLISKTIQTAYHPIPLVASSESYELSSSQRRLWVLNQFEESNSAYNMPGVYEFKGHLDIHVFNAAFETLLERHEILRTSFTENGAGEVVQRIAEMEDVRFSPGYYDLRRELNKEERLNSLIQSSFNVPFDLTQSPLLRAYIYQLQDDQYIFGYVLHHIISDGWSMGILIRELILLYEAYSRGADNPLHALKIQYKDYAAWQQEQLKGEMLNQHRNYWLDQFNDELPVLSLPASNLRPEMKTYKGRMVHRTISGKTSQELKELVQQEGCTLFMGLLTVLNALLYRYTGQKDIIIGTPIAGREHNDLHDQIGIYINTLALRTRFEAHDTYLDLLKNVKHVTLDAYEHQVYPFDELVDELRLRRDTSRSALFDVMLVLHNTDMSDASVKTILTDLRISRYPFTEEVNSKFDLTINVIDLGKELQIALEYNVDIYSQKVIEHFASHFEQFLTSALEKPSHSISLTEYLSKDEKTLLLETFNDTVYEYPKNKAITDLFEEQALKTPDAVAVVFGNTSLTYRQVNEKANQLAHYLRDEHATTHNDLIGIMVDRSEWMLIGLLGILKSGAAYVPIDPDYPKERTSYIIKDSGISLLLIDNESRVFSNQVVLSEKTIAGKSGLNPQPGNDKSELAYVIYTSGSTGRPKGVEVYQHGVVNFLLSMANTLAFKESETLLAVTTFSFDIAVLELFLPLITGAKVIIVATETVRDPHLLQSIIATHDVSMIQATPSFWRMLMDSGWNGQSSLKALCGGEKLSAELGLKLLDLTPSCWNMYGPTETTIWSTMSAIGNDFDRFKNPSIGKPIHNTTVYILDDALQIVPIGVIGNMYIGGEGLSRGYLNQPALTKEKFIENPYLQNGKIYKTGDLAKWLSDGSIEYIGRIDEQVKISGYRIELGEIESVLAQVEGVRQNVVLVKEIEGRKDDKFLVAYVTLEPDTDIKLLKQKLVGLLPSYMVPSYYMEMDHMPLTPNGKIDRKAFPDPNELQAKDVYQAPQSPIEIKLTAIWGEVLNIPEDKISVTADFFELGGNSIRAMKVLSKIQVEFSLKLNFRELFLKQSILNLASHITLLLNNRDNWDERGEDVYDEYLI